MEILRDVFVRLPTLEYGSTYTHAYDFFFKQLIKSAKSNQARQRSSMT